MDGEPGLADQHAAERNPSPGKRGKTEAERRAGDRPEHRPVNEMASVDKVLDNRPEEARKTASQTPWRQQGSFVCM